MYVDYYRLAYNIFYRNWQRFGIPEKDIPFPKAEKVDSLDLIIPGFSKAVALFQITLRSDLKTFFDECERVHNISDFYTRFEKIMKQVFPERFVIIKDLPKDTIPELPMDTLKDDLSKGAMMKSLPEVAVEDQSKDTTEENLSKDSKKDDNKIKPEEVPELIAFTLAVCTELILYQYEDTKEYMKNMPDMWLKYFKENLKDLCDEAGCISDHLNAYSESIQCPDNFLNKFVSENKNEYDHIEAKFRDYMETNYAVASPEHIKFITEDRQLPEELCFAKMKTQFRAIVESCKCVKGMTTEEMPLLSDYSPSTPTSP